MARTTETVTTVTDDLTGKVIEGTATEVVVIINGQGTTLDLSDDSVAKFETAVSKFMKDADRVPMRVAKTAATTQSKYPAGYLAGVREWAKAEGIEVPRVGIVRKDVIEKYESAMKS